MSVIAFLRRDAPAAVALVACNFTPVPRENYRVGVPRGGRWRERLNSDAGDYGGSGLGNSRRARCRAGSPAHGHGLSLHLKFPPLAMVVLTPGS